jgi:hypothetical protein
LFRPRILACLAWLAVPTGVQAAWPVDGLPLTPAGVDAEDSRIVSDGQGGVFVAWTDSRSGIQFEIYGSHITADGQFSLGWPPQDTPICTAPGSYASLFSAVPDGQGGAIFAWADERNGLDVYAQRMMADGTVALGWPINGSRAGPGQQPVMVADGLGGVFLAWRSGVKSVAAQHLLANGSIAPGWPVDGTVLSALPSTTPLSLIPDGNDGVIIAWDDFRRGGLAKDSTSDIYAQHLTASGAIAPGWITNGLLLVSNAWTPIVLPDPMGGFYLIAGAVAADAGGDSRYTVYRFNLDGTPESGWPTSGVVVCSPPTGDRQNLNAVSDGLGGILMDWYDDRNGGYDIYASRVLPTGFAPGFPQGGVRISNPTIGVEYLEPAGEIASDGLGGGYFVWRTSQSIGSPSYLQHVTGAGDVAPGWPQYGLRVASTCVQGGPQIASDGFGGAVVSWHELDGNCSRLGVYAQRYVMDGVVATEVSLASAEVEADRVTLTWQSATAQGVVGTVYRRTETNSWQSMGSAVLDGPDRLQFVDRSVVPGSRYAYRLGYSNGGAEQFTQETWVDIPAPRLALDGLRPNPSPGAMTVSFSLPDAQPASLEVVDVSGRRVAQREVGSLGIGPHVLRLAETGSLQPGIYWLRLRQGDRALLSRGVVVR